MTDQNKKGVTFQTEASINLADDPAETNNVYDKHPDVVKKLTKEFDRIRSMESSR